MPYQLVVMRQDRQFLGGKKREFWQWLYQLPLVMECCSKLLCFMIIFIKEKLTTWRNCYLWNPRTAVIYGKHKIIWRQQQQHEMWKLEDCGQFTEKKLPKAKLSFKVNQLSKFTYLWMYTLITYPFYQVLMVDQAKGLSL